MEPLSTFLFYQVGFCLVSYIANEYSICCIMIKDLSISFSRVIIVQDVKTATFNVLGPVHMMPGQLIAPGQLTDPGVSFT